MRWIKSAEFRKYRWCSSVSAKQLPVEGGGEPFMAVISVKEEKWVGVWVGERGFGTEVIVVCSLFFTSMRPQADIFFRYVLRLLCQTRASMKLIARYSISRGSTLSNFARCGAICETACYIALKLHIVSALFFSGKLLSLFRGDELICWFHF